MNSRYVSKESWDLYSYGLVEKLASYILVLPFAVIAVGTALMAICGATMCLMLALKGEAADWRLFWAPIVMFLCSGPLCAIILNMYPDIRTSKDGLAV